MKTDLTNELKAAQRVIEAVPALLAVADAVFAHFTAVRAERVLLPSEIELWQMADDAQAVALGRKAVAPTVRPADEEIKRGSVVTCVERYAHVQCITVGQDYKVLEVVERGNGRRDLKFVIRDDNGKKRTYGEKPMFEVKSY